MDDETPCERTGGPSTRSNSGKSWARDSLKRRIVRLIDDGMQGSSLREQKGILIWRHGTTEEANGDSETGRRTSFVTLACLYRKRRLAKAQVI